MNIVGRGSPEVIMFNRERQVSLTCLKSQTTERGFAIGKNTVTDWSGQTLFVGIDVGKNRWAVTVRTVDIELKKFVTDGKESCFKALLWIWPGAIMRTALLE